MLRIELRPRAGEDWLSAIAAALQAQGLELRRAELRELVKSGRVLRDGRALRLSSPVEACWLQLPLILPPQVLYQDEHLLAVHKPAGLLTHPTADPSRPDLVTWVRRNLNAEAVLQHRLDLETSGVVLFTLSDAARAPVAQAFAEHRLEKVYLACTAARTPGQGLIELSLGEQRGRVRPDPAGKPAVTEYRTLKREGNWSWLQLRPRHGRKHQLRVHCAAQGWPLRGDQLYGGPSSERLWLHAWQLKLEHPLQQRELTICAPPGQTGQSAELELCANRR